MEKWDSALKEILFYRTNPKRQSAFYVKTEEKNSW
jgi:hypothetical protein